MKKGILFVACAMAVLLAPAVRAQKLMFGPKLGANLSQLKTTDVSNILTLNNVNTSLANMKSNYTGFVGGAFLRASFAGMYVQPEVVISAKGGEFERRILGTTPTTENVKVRMTSVDVPVMLGYKFAFFRVNAGPVAQFRLSSLNELRDALSSYTSSPSSAVKSAVWGFQAGVGIDLGKATVDLRYEGSLSKLTDAGLGSTNINFSQRTALWQVSVGYNVF